MTRVTRILLPAVVLCLAVAAIAATSIPADSGRAEAVERALEANRRSGRFDVKPWGVVEPASRPAPAVWGATGPILDVRPSINPAAPMQTR